MVEVQTSILLFWWVLVSLRFTWDFFVAVSFFFGSVKDRILEMHKCCTVPGGKSMGTRDSCSISRVSVAWGWKMPKHQLQLCFFEDVLSNSSWIMVPSGNQTWQWIVQTSTNYFRANHALKKMTDSNSVIRILQILKIFMDLRRPVSSWRKTKQQEERPSQLIMRTMLYISLYNHKVHHRSSAICKFAEVTATQKRSFENPFVDSKSWNSSSMFILTASKKVVVRDRSQNMPIHQ